MSIVQVAKLAHVSHATVSRVLNNRPNVSEETVQQVRAAMKKLGFKARLRRPGRKPAGALAGRTGNVALLFPGMDPALPRLSVIAHVIAGIQQALAARGYSLILGRGEQTDRVPEVLQQGRADAVLAMGVPPDPAVLAELQRQPFLWLLGDAPAGVDSVLPDNAAIGTLAARYLAERGCQRVAFINPQIEHGEYVRRGLFFTLAARAAGLDVTTVESEVGHRIGMWTPAEGSAAVERVAQQLSDLTPRPQGIFVPSDELTVYLAGALERRGLKFATFTTVSCNNDETWLPLLHPRPASIDPQMEALGRWAVEMLLRQRTDLTLCRGVRLAVPPTLVPAPSRKNP